MMKAYPLEGVRTCELSVLPDERGLFADALKAPGKERRGHDIHRLLEEL